MRDQGEAMQFFVRNLQDEWLRNPPPTKTIQKEPNVASNAQTQVPIIAPPAVDNSLTLGRGRRIKKPKPPVSTPDATINARPKRLGRPPGSKTKYIYKPEVSSTPVQKLIPKPVKQLPPSVVVSNSNTLEDSAEYIITVKPNSILPVKIFPENDSKLPALLVQRIPAEPEVSESVEPNQNAAETQVKQIQMAQDSDIPEQNAPLDLSTKNNYNPSLNLTEENANLLTQYQPPSSQMPTMSFMFPEMLSAAQRLRPYNPNDANTTFIPDRSQVTPSAQPGKITHRVRVDDFETTAIMRNKLIFLANIPKPGPFLMPRQNVRGLQAKQRPRLARQSVMVDLTEESDSTRNVPVIDPDTETGDAI